MIKRGISGSGIRNNLLYLYHSVFRQISKCMKSTVEILEILRTYKLRYADKYGLRRIGVFGSVARGEQSEDSDVDICYEGEALSLLTLDYMQSELEKLLGCSVDLVRIRERMNARLKERILKEGIYV